MASLELLKKWLDKQEGGFAGTAFSSSDSGIFTPTFGGDGTASKKKRKKERHGVTDALPGADSVSFEKEEIIGEDNPVIDIEVDYANPEWIQYIREQIDLKTGMSIRKAQIKVGEISFNVECAVGIQQQQRGLSFRESIPASHGMLFVFGDGMPHKFHMKGMEFPLDFVVIGENNTVVQLEKNVRPNNRSIITTKPCNAVLEIKAGESKNIKLGDPVEGFTFANIFLSKQQLSQGAIEAKRKGLIPKTGNWEHPGRWIKPEDEEKLTESRMNFSFKADAEKALNLWEKYSREIQEEIESELDEQKVEFSIGVMEELQNAEDFSRFIVDNNGNVEAAAIVYDYDEEIMGGNVLKIEQAATNPKNLPFSNHPEKVKGAGTSLLHGIFQEALEKNKESVVLEPAHGSETFWSKFGFEESDDGIHMEINQNQIRTYLGTISKMFESFDFYGMFLSKQMSAPYLAGQSDWSYANQARMPEKSGFNDSDAEYIRDLSEKGVLNEIIQEGGSIEKDLNSHCKMCDLECNCVFGEGCSCEHDCLCPDHDLVKNCEDCDIIIDVEKLCI